MCLDTADKETIKDVQYAWKLFLKNEEGKLHCIYREEHKARKRGVWLKSSEGTVSLPFSHRSYPSGFHSYIVRKDAEQFIANIDKRYICLKVKVKNIVASGEQGGRQVVVHRQMRIMPPEKED